MDKEIINTDGSRNWEANILFDNVKRLEQENAELKEKNTALEETLQTIEQLKDEDSLRVAQLVTENARKTDMIERQWKLLEQCGVSAGGELKRVSYLLEKLRTENARLKEGKDFLAMSIIELAAENEQLKKENEKLLHQKNTMTARYGITYTTLQEIKKIVKDYVINSQNYTSFEIAENILDCITKAEEE